MAEAMTTPEAIARVEELGQSTYWTEEEISDARTLCSRLARELKEAREALEWQPIETAPRDGTRILGWSAEYGQRETYMRHYQKGSPGFDAFERGEGPSESGWDWQEPKNNWSLNWKPTHWKPLPAPPQPSPESTK